MLHETGKRAVSMSLSLVIAAIIALIVLAVLVYIFTNKAAMFQRGTQNCGGQCAVTADQCAPNTIPILFPSCDNDPNNQYCCLSTGEGG